MHDRRWLRCLAGGMPRRARVKGRTAARAGVGCRAGERPTGQARRPCTLARHAWAAGAAAPLEALRLRKRSISTATRLDPLALCACTWTPLTASTVTTTTTTATSLAE